MSWILRTNQSHRTIATLFLRNITKVFLRHVCEGDYNRKWHRTGLIRVWNFYAFCLSDGGWFKRPDDGIYKKNKRPDTYINIFMKILYMTGTSWTTLFLSRAVFQIFVLNTRGLGRKYRFCTNLFYQLWNNLSIHVDKCRDFEYITGKAKPTVSST